MLAKKVLRVAISMLLVLLAWGASPAQPAAGSQPPQYFVDESKLPFAAIPGLDTQRYWGVLSGAGYRIEVPAAWNGELVLWAHGYRGTGLELTVDDHPLRAYLIANGYAWAASSYSRNDYDVEAGVQDTHALLERFNGIVGHPSRVYLTGASMGGHVTAAAIEQYPNDFDGAMPLCGVLGDHKLFDFYLDYNLVAAALAGVSTSFPPDPVQWTTQTIPQIQSALAVQWPAVLKPAGQGLKKLTELRSGGNRPLFDAAWVSWATFLLQFGALDGTVPRSPGVVVDNHDAVYQLDDDPAISPAEQTLNESVVRVTAEPSGVVEHGVDNVPVVNGTPTIPVLTMHDVGDMFVPFSMEQVYAQRVAAAGRSDLVVQRAIRGVGHCDFTAAEMVRAFTDLVNWVEKGVHPAGDDVLTPSVVADPKYGCTFTTATRNLGPFTAPC